MQPSSLIFVVVIGIWAAFLVQYWVRRREHLATARSVDRFSEAMRVLDRRSRAIQMSTAAGNGSDGSEPPTAGSPGSTEASRPSPASAGARPSPLVARGPVERPLATFGDVPEPGPSHRAAHKPGGATLRAARRGPSPAARRVRALGLALALAVVPVTVVAAVLGLAPRWTVAVAVAEAGLCLLALRLAAVRARTARLTDRSMRSSRGGRPDATAPRTSRHSASAPGRPAHTDRPLLRRSLRPGATSPERQDDGGEVGPRREPADSAGPSTGSRPVAAEEPALPAYRPGDPTWRPVPVPRPTYQLKNPAPSARRVRPPQQRPFDGQAQPESSVRPRPPRRVVGG